MNLWFILIPLVILASLWISFFSRIFIQLILKDDTKKASFTWLGCGFNLDWSAQKTCFYLFGQKVLTNSMRKKQVKVKKAGKKRKVNYIILWKKKDVILKILKITLRALIDMLRKTRLERFALSLKIATPEPAFTGIVYGTLSSLSYSLRPFLPLKEVYIYPDFQAETPRANLEVSLKTRFFHVIWIGLKTFLLLPKISLLKTVKKAFH
ncbi:MAG TPA: DUF2953 domain-containing protein [Terriglobales bacterium]|nr:DUF2953 domain-containing protein [Terriglobales bacterium]